MEQIVHTIMKLYELLSLRENKTKLKKETHHISSRKCPKSLMCIPLLF
jgi:hypothetical protein